MGMLLLLRDENGELIVIPPEGGDGDGSGGATAIDRASIDIPHFAFPFRRGDDGHVVLCEQDTIEHVDACAQLVIRCPIGFRDERPDFGWPFPEFQPAPIDVRPVEIALQKWGHSLGSPSATEYGDVIDAAIRFIDIVEEAQ